DRAPAEVPSMALPYWLVNDTGAWLHRRMQRRAAQDVVPAVDQFAPTTLDVVVHRLRQAARQVQQIWLPPLLAALPFNPVRGEVVIDSGHGLTVADPARRGRLRIPIGLLDKPAEQWQGPCELDLSGSGGHVAIMGAPQTGKSGALRALVA